MTKLMKALLPLNPLIADAITFIIAETVTIFKCLILKMFLKKVNILKYKYNLLLNFLRKFVVILLQKQASVKTDSSFW